MVSNCTEFVANLKKYYLSPFYGLEFCIGFPGNLLVILGYLFCLEEWQSCNIYLFNMAASDLIFLCTLPCLSRLYSNDLQETNIYFCIINRYVLFVNLYSSILFMVWVSMDRFLLIKHPTRNHYLLKRRSALLLTGLTWIVVNVEITPMIFLMIQDFQRGNSSLCNNFAILKGDISLLGYNMSLTVTGYLLPLLGLCIFSQKIAHLLHAKERVLHLKVSYKRPLRVVTSAAVLFFILYSPYHILRAIRIVSQSSWMKLSPCTFMNINAVYILTRPLAFLHSVINPVFNFFMGDKFRNLLTSKIREIGNKRNLRRDQLSLNTI